MLYNPPTVSRELARDAYDGRNSYSKYAPYCDNVDGVSIDDLVAQYGSPLFVFSERTVVDAARRMKKAFKNYPNTVFGWSYKTNYLRRICDIFHREGWIAEVVSEFEYQKARKSGIEGKDIIYNGPQKSKESLEIALKEGALIQIDNWDELDVIENMVEKMARVRDVTPRRVYNVGIRIWMNNRYLLQQSWSKFGFSLDNGEAIRAAMRIVSNSNLKLHTLHSHIGTQVLEPKAYGFAAERLVDLREMLFEQTGQRAAAINLGGGFPSSNLWHIEPEDTKHPMIEEYAKAITSVLNKIPAKRRPQLRLETGRHLIDEAGYLVSSVAAVKGMEKANEKPIKGKASRGGYILDVGVHLLYCCSWFRIKAMPTKKVSQLYTGTAKLFGCLCMVIDVIREEVELPALEVNDKVVFHPVGAYNITQSMQFINLRPAVVMVGLDGNAKVIRRREELIDVDGAEC